MPKTDPRWVSEIRRLRTLHPNLGKAKLHVLLAPWCAQHGIGLPSVSTLGRIIARDPQKMRHAPARIDSRGRSRPLKRQPKPRKPKQVSAYALEGLAGDTIERIRDGIRRYIVTFIDPRFNRTIQESFVDYHEELLFTDLALFNRKLADWLVFYNAERPHHALGQPSPLSFLLQHQPECQRYWTHRQSCLP